LSLDMSLDTGVCLITYLLSYPLVIYTFSQDDEEICLVLRNFLPLFLILNADGFKMCL